MSVDTTEVDKQITDLTAQAEAAQAEVDNDPLGQQLNALKAKSDAAADFNSKLGVLKMNREALIFIDGQITELSAKLATLQTSIAKNQLGVDQQAQVI